MPRSTQLNEFNKLFVEKYLRVFPLGVLAQQSDDDKLLFRGPLSPGSTGADAAVTHAVVSPEPDLRAAMEGTEPAAKAEMMEVLLSNLGTQLRARYDHLNIGQYALRVVGTKDTLGSM